MTRAGTYTTTATPPPAYALASAAYAPDRQTRTRITPEPKGAAGVQDYGMRLYSPAIGRFLSTDPLAPQYAELSPYQFASNSPISGADRDGLEYELRIFSPQISKAFLKAIDAGDIVEQRRLTNYALRHEFVGVNGAESRWASSIGGNNSLERHNAPAKLAYDNVNYADGLTVVLYAWEIGENISFSPPKNARESRAADIVPSDQLHFAWSEGNNPDRYFPVDIKLLDSDGTAQGNDFYGDYDFLGSGAESNFLGSGTGFLAGRIRGLGYLEFSVKVVGASPSLSFGAISVTGSYGGAGATPTSPFAMLDDFTGVGSQSPNTGEWTSSSGDWTGDSGGFGVDAGIGIGTRQTTLTTLFHEFRSSSTQGETMTRSETNRTDAQP